MFRGLISLTPFHIKLLSILFSVMPLDKISSCPKIAQKLIYRRTFSSFISTMFSFTKSFCIAWIHNMLSSLFSLSLSFVISSLSSRYQTSSIFRPTFAWITMSPSIKPQYKVSRISLAEIKIFISVWG